MHSKTRPHPAREFLSPRAREQQILWLCPADYGMFAWIRRRRFGSRSAQGPVSAHLSRSVLVAVWAGVAPKRSLMRLDFFVLMHPKRPLLLPRLGRLDWPKRPEMDAAISLQFKLCCRRNQGRPTALETQSRGGHSGSLCVGTRGRRSERRLHGRPVQLLSHGPR